jgi:biotin carboxyl carrier protein
MPVELNPSADPQPTARQRTSDAAAAANATWNRCMDRDTTLTSPVNGTATAVEIEDGATVHAGQVLLRLESMKMEFVVEAPHAGQVVDRGSAVPWSTRATLLSLRACRARPV